MANTVTNARQMKACKCLKNRSDPSTLPALAGTMTGSSIDAEDTLSFSSLQQIRPMIETVPLADAADAYGRMMRNEARFRIVLVTGQ